MADSDRSADLHATRQELRAPPAGSGTRPGWRPARADDRAAAPAWDWSADEFSADALAELRAAVAALHEQVAELEPAVARARERERELRGALRKLAAAGPRQRRQLTGELRGRGLL
jgi:hypothetical protein